MKLLLGEAVGGLHTMVDEHFGIGIVQYMAAGAPQPRATMEHGLVTARQPADACLCTNIDRSRRWMREPQQCVSCSL